PALLLSFSARRPPPTSTLFPYTTLFRSRPWPPRRAARGQPCSGGRGHRTSSWRGFGIASRGTVKRREDALVELDRRLRAELCRCRRRLLPCIADRPVSAEPLLEHAGEQRNCRIHVIVDAHFGLPRAQPVKAPGVLDERALPRHGHGQEEGVQARVVESLADVASGRENEALL